MLNLQEIVLSYGKTKVLKDFNIEVMDQELFGLVGPENSGKSSVCKIVTGLVVPDHGIVTLDGKNIFKEEQYQRSIGYLPERVEDYDYQQVLEYLIFFGEIYGMSERKSKERAREVLEYIGMEKLEETYVTKLPKGDRQKLGFGRAMMHHPKLLVLDELLTGLDPVSKIEIQSLLIKIKQNGTSVLLTSNSLETASKLCDKIAILDDGVLVTSGTVDEIQHLKQSSNPILIRVNGMVEEAVTVLRKNPLVTALSRKDNVLSVRFQGKDGEEAALLTELIQHQVEVSAFYREESDFDSLYLKITSK